MSAYDLCAILCNQKHASIKYLRLPSCQRNWQWAQKMQGITMLSRNSITKYTFNLDSAAALWRRRWNIWFSQLTKFWQGKSKNSLWTDDHNQPCETFQFRHTMLWLTQYHSRSLLSCTYAWNDAGGDRSRSVFHPRRTLFDFIIIDRANFFHKAINKE